MGNKKKNKDKDKKKRNKSKNGVTARSVDKFKLYQRSVQDPPQDIKFLQRIFKKDQGRPANTLREDFCGTALLCADWVRSNKQRSAWGVDLDGPTLEWGRQQNVAPLGDDATRVHLMQRNVLDGIGTKVDITVAFNFSYCVFHRRAEMVRYAESVRRGLASGGLFCLDIHGGSELTVEQVEETDHKKFTYVWDQRPYDPINGLGVRHIHFRFKDGSQLRKAFTYDWRLWTLPELKDILYDAGFDRVDVYWEGADDAGEGNGVFKRVTKAEEEQSWIAYVAAWNP